jgi:hypothetical protein
MARAIVISKVGEENRLLVLEAIGDRKITSVELRTIVNMKQVKLANYLLALQRTGYLKVDTTHRNAYLYSRTSKPFIPTALEIADDEEEVPEEPTNPYARVIRLLDRPTDSTPRRTQGSRSMYGGMQSGMQSGMALFGWE